jgi:ketosteroid isomerase-like protein
MDTARELTLIEEQLAASWVAGDHTYHERVLSEDWTVTDPSGRILTKADVLREAFSGERKIDKGKVDQINVRDFGEWAIVTGRTQMSGRYQGRKMDVVLRFTDIFARTDREWKCVASHGTYVIE